MAERITTSLVVEFKRGTSGGILNAEWDARPDGFNKGITSFAPGDQPAFLIYKSNDVVVDAISSTSGNTIDLGTGTHTVTETLLFTDTDEASPSKPVYSGLTTKWLGNSLGALTLVGGSKLKAASRGIGVLKITYNTQYIAKRLVNVPATLNGETEFSVIVFIEGHSE